MIISHRHKFSFIKTLKTAGTSIEVFLSDCCGPQDVVTPIYPSVGRHEPRNHEGYFNHMPAHAVREKVGLEIWNSYFKFCVERDPWDKTLSYYFMMKVRRGEELTLDTLIADNEFPINHPIYTDPENPDKILVDRVLDYSNLSTELGVTFVKLGIPFSGSLDIHAKSEYRTDRRPWQEVYTPSQSEAVAQAFRQELRLRQNNFAID